MAFNPSVASTLSWLYLGAFARPPLPSSDPSLSDPGGLAFWTDQYLAGGAPYQGDVVAIADFFVSSTEFQETYGDVNDSQFVTLLYQNMLGRGPDVEGLSFWLGRLEDGESRGAILADFANTPEFQELEANAPFAAAMESFIVALSNGESPEDWLAENPQYDPAEIVGAGETFTLTTDIDTFTGTDGNDTFNAPLVGDGNNPQNTLQSFDVLDGGAGTDTLNATLRSTNVTPTIASVEIFNLTEVGAGSTVNMSNVSGAEQLWNVGSTDDLTLDDVQAPAAVGLRDVAAGTTYAVSYAADAAPETQTVVLEGAGTASESVTLDLDGNGDIQHLNFLANAGVNNLVLDGDLPFVSSLTVSGVADLMLDGAGFLDMETVDASAYSGDLDLDVSASAVLESVVTGSGDDQITVAAAHFTAGVDVLQTLDLGDGMNTLVLTDTIDAGGFDGDGLFSPAEINELNFSLAAISGVQKLAIDRFGGWFAFNNTDAVLDLTGLDDLTTLGFAGDNDLYADSGNHLILEGAPTDLLLEVDRSYWLSIDFGAVENLAITGTDVFFYDLGLGKGGLAGLNLVSVDVAVDDFAEVMIDGSTVDALTTLSVEAGGDANISLQGSAGDDLVQLEAAVLAAQTARDDALVAKANAESDLTDAQDAFTDAQTAFSAQLALKTAVLNAEQTQANFAALVATYEEALTAFGGDPAPLAAFQALVDAYNNALGDLEAADLAVADALTAQSAFQVLVDGYNGALGAYVDTDPDTDGPLETAYAALTTYDPVAFLAIPAAADIFAADGATQTAITAEEGVLAGAVTAAQDDFDAAETALEAAYADLTDYDVAAFPAIAAAPAIVAADGTTQDSISAEVAVLQAIADGDPSPENALALIAAYAALTDYDPVLFEGLASASDILLVQAATAAAILAETTALEAAVVAAQGAYDLAGGEVELGLLQTALSEAQTALNAALLVFADAETAFDEAEQALADALGALANPADAEGFESLETVTASGASADVDLTDVYGNFTLDVVAEDGFATMNLVRTGVVSIDAEANTVMSLYVFGGDALESVSLLAGDDIVSVIEQNSGAFTFDAVAGGPLTGEFYTTGVTSIDVEVGGDAFLDVVDAGNLATVNVLAGEWADVTVEAAEVLETVTIATGEDVGLTSVLTLVDTPSVNLIDVSGVAGVAGSGVDNSGIDVDVIGAAFDGAVTILIGESDVDYSTDAANGVREAFVFTGEGTGEVFIDGFNASVGATGDRLDFSQLAGIDSVDDLNLEEVGGDTVITSAVEGIDVDITLVGVIATDDPAYFVF